MMKFNKSIHTIYFLNLHYSQHELFRTSVDPYLDTNRFRPRVRAIQKSRPTAYRAKMLGLALLSARNDSNSFWMLLSGNADVAFPSNSTAIAAATSLPTPATAVADTSTTQGAAFALSIMSVLTTTVTGSFPIAAAAAAPSTASASASDPATAAANVATPSTSQKRKAIP
jgi:hypothetical protein